MAKTLAALVAAITIGAAAFIHSTPASAEPWAARAWSPCYADVGVDCYGNPRRGLFTGGFGFNLFGGGCGCESGGYPHYYHRYHPYFHHFYRHYYRRHLYRSYMRHSYHRHGAYRMYHRGHYRHW